ncbi:MAG: hotdog fold thioesterase [Candidatus Lokiarchaeota archaeon]|nr:hotdog fold thioesterase [Candidatus Lokiarchaeota archaeon]
MNIDELKKEFQNDKFSRKLGIEAVEISKGKAITKVNLSDGLQNFFGLGHGGAIYAVADVAFSLACNADEDIKLAVALNSNINYIKKTTVGDTITAEAKVISTSRKTSITEILIRNQDNELIAKFEGLAYLKRYK